MVNPDPDELVLNCYRLADRFHQNPDLFLDMPYSRVQDHIYYLIKLIDKQHEAQRRAADSEDD